MQLNTVRRLGTFGAVALGIAGYWQWLNVEPRVQIPTPVLPSPNAHDALYDAAKLELDDTKVSEAHVANPPKDHHLYSLTEKEALIAENAPALTALRNALPMPFYNPPARSVHALMPEFAKYRALARLLLLESQVRAARGDKAGAMSSCLDAVEIGIKVPRGGVMLAALVGYACETIGEKPTWSVVDKLNADEATFAAKRLETLMDQRVPFTDTLREEKWFGQAMLAEVFRNKSTFQAWSDMHRATMVDGENNNDDTLSTAKDTIHAYKSLLTHSKRQIVADYTATMDASIAQAAKPIQITAVPAAGSDAFNELLTPVWKQAQLKDTSTRMNCGLLLCSLALRSYSLRHGSYPEALTDLVSDGTLRRLPDDPFALEGGKPFGYRRADSGTYVLYSVGPDGIDDGGRAIDTTSVGKQSTRTWPEVGDRGDWVVGVDVGKPDATIAPN